MKRWYGLLAISLSAAGMATAADGAIISQYAFPTLESAESGPGYAPTLVASGVTASDVNGTGAAGTFTIDNPPTSYATQPVLRFDADASTTAATAVTGNLYVQFTITAGTGNALDLDNLTFSAGRGGASAARGYVVRSSADGFTTNLAAADIPTQRPTFTTINVPLTAPAFNNLPSITIRLYTYTTGDGATVEYDDITLNGAVVPEPTALALIPVAGLLLSRRRRAPRA